MLSILTVLPSLLAPVARLAVPASRPAAALAARFDASPKMQMMMDYETPFSYRQGYGRYGGYGMGMVRPTFGMGRYGGYGGYGMGRYGMGGMMGGYDYYDSYSWNGMRSAEERAAMRGRPYYSGYGMGGYGGYGMGRGGYGMGRGGYGMGRYGMGYGGCKHRCTNSVPLHTLFSPWPECLPLYPGCVGSLAPDGGYGGYGMGGYGGYGGYGMGGYGGYGGYGMGRYGGYGMGRYGGYGMGP